jgi:hypothetical protein
MKIGLVDQYALWRRRRLLPKFQTKTELLLGHIDDNITKRVRKKSSSLIKTNVKDISILVLSDFAIYPSQGVVSNKKYSWPQSDMIIFSLRFLSEKYFPL